MAALPLGTVVVVHRGPLAGTWVRARSVFETAGFSDLGAQRWVDAAGGEVDGNGVAWCLERGYGRVEG